MTKRSAEKVAKAHVVKKKAAAKVKAKKLTHDTHKKATKTTVSVTNSQHI